MHKLLDDAVLFAAKAHFGHSRRYTGLPYLSHCLEVMETVASVSHNPEMLVTAVLHDTIEDTSTTAQEISLLFGVNVARMVLALSDLEHGNRAERKAAAARRLSAAPPEVQTIKLADILSNTPQIVKHDLKFAPVYLAEIRNLLGVMNKGDRALYKRAVDTLGKAEAAVSAATGKPFPA